ncbi:HAMP domain-containing sensor histidine kinase [Gemmatimonas sp.]|jgi:signal transduction histidine kinase|uniref:sensor histidine kinase n=1 Tax=Gemmatimonas sp. TaxID=1962908 RepID=UPI0022BF861F|nr:HAMP domain-containing sensor histidine kinase [Gemmatimonas sp.]MCZ8204083.1 HAMP domain-containing sensor histidine kinase [Gemmatimonas sp.]
MTPLPLHSAAPSSAPDHADASLDTSPEAVDALIAAGTVALRGPRGIADHPADRTSTSESDLLLLSLTHDLKSPLGGLMLTIDQLHSGMAGPLTATQEHLLGRARSAAQSMAILISSLGDVAAQSSPLAAVDRVFSLRGVLEDVRAATRPLFEDRRLYLRVSIDRADAYRGNPLVFHRTLLNLVVNAITFTEVGGITITVSEESDGTLVTRVIDSGIGLSEPGSTPCGAIERRGLPMMPSGIGLGICMRLLDLVGGTLSLEDNAGAGTTATVRLPRRQPS